MAKRTPKSQKSIPAPKAMEPPETSFIQLVKWVLLKVIYQALVAVSAFVPPDSWQWFLIVMGQHLASLALRKINKDRRRTRRY